MNENVNLAKILEGCPRGTKLYSPIFGEVTFSEITDDAWLPISTINAAGYYSTFTKRGYYYDNFEDEGAECLLFPSKEQRDWSKFERFWDKPKVGRFNPKTFQPFDKVLVRDNNTMVWRTDFYSFYDDRNRNGYPFNTTGGCYHYVIPYNDDTKHLVGSTDDCPEFYKWWED